MRAAIRKVISLDFAGGTRTPREIAEAIEAQDAEFSKGTALVLTQDAKSAQWAPRWLGQAGIEGVVAGTLGEALDIAGQSRPRLLIADAALIAAGGSTFAGLREMDGVETPVIALCASTADVATADEAGVTDVVRRPFDWNVIANRAVLAIDAAALEDKLHHANDRLERIHSSVSQAEREREKRDGIDPISGLPNRERFRTLLSKVTASSSRSEGSFCLLAIGLDRFRLVTEAVGHENADRILSLFADRLRRCLRDRQIIGGNDAGWVTAVAARISGARFGLLFSNADEDQIACIHRAITDQLEQPFEVSGQSVYLTASVGAAFYPGDTVDANKLLHFAENAMLDAQETGTRFQYHRQDQRVSSAQIIKLDCMLREAIRNGDLKLAYQPITDAETGEVVAAEALLRWHHEEEGDISPGLFVPIAEKTGLMKEIGDFVVRQACVELRRWLDEGLLPIRIAVNLSLCQLLRGNTVSVVETALKENNLDPSMLEIELSERGVLNQRPEVIQEVWRLKAIGVRISIDDFGTGQSAIGYLKDLPVDVIKIDRSYISGAERSSRDEAIASGMVALAQRLDATVIAEGVETEAQLAMLRGWGAPECQGFLFSPALSGGDFMAHCGV